MTYKVLGGTLNLTHLQLLICWSWSRASWTRSPINDSQGWGRRLESRDSNWTAA